MVPLGIFRSRPFSVVNAATLLIYGAMGGLFFWLVLQLQVVSGFWPLAAGLALLPITLLLLLLSSRMGALGDAPRSPGAADRRAADLRGRRRSRWCGSGPAPATCST